MTPAVAINHVLDSVDGLAIDGTDDDVVTTLLAAATAIAGIAALRLAPFEREVVLFGLEHGVRDYINKVLARRSMTPKAANGHAS